MALVYETDNFEVVTHEHPFVSREEGGHIKIVVKEEITDRTKLSVLQAKELMRLTMIVGEAFQIAMNNRGIPVVKINYEELGNWAYKTDKPPKLHIHIFGRAENSKKQVFPEAVYLPSRESGFYEDFIPLNDDDIEELKKQIKIIENEDKYRIENWI